MARKSANYSASAPRPVSGRRQQPATRSSARLKAQADALAAAATAAEEAGPSAEPTVDVQPASMSSAAAPQTVDQPAVAEPAPEPVAQSASLLSRLSAPDAQHAAQSAAEPASPLAGLPAAVAPQPTPEPSAPRVSLLSRLSAPVSEVTSAPVAAHVDDRSAGSWFEGTAPVSDVSDAERAHAATPVAQDQPQPPAAIEAAFYAAHEVFTAGYEPYRFDSAPAASPADAAAHSASHNQAEFTVFSSPRRLSGNLSFWIRRSREARLHGLRPALAEAAHPYESVVRPVLPRVREHLVLLEVKREVRREARIAKRYPLRPLHSPPHSSDADDELSDAAPVVASIPAAPVVAAVPAAPQTAPSAPVFFPQGHHDGPGYAYNHLRHLPAAYQPQSWQTPSPPAEPAQQYYLQQEQQYAVPVENAAAAWQATPTAGATQHGAQFSAYARYDESAPADARYVAQPAYVPYDWRSGLEPPELPYEHAHGGYVAYDGQPHVHGGVRSGPARTEKQPRLRPYVPGTSPRRAPSPPPGSAPPGPALRPRHTIKIVRARPGPERMVLDGTANVPVFFPAHVAPPDVPDVEMAFLAPPADPGLGEIELSSDYGDDEPQTPPAASIGFGRGPGFGAVASSAFGSGPGFGAAAGSAFGVGKGFGIAAVSTTVVSTTGGFAASTPAFGLAPARTTPAPTPASPASPASDASTSAGGEDSNASFAAYGAGTWSAVAFGAAESHGAFGATSDAGAFGGRSGSGSGSGSAVLGANAGRLYPRGADSPSRGSYRASAPSPPPARAASPLVAIKEEEEEEAPYSPSRPVADSPASPAPAAYSPSRPQILTPVPHAAPLPRDPPPPAPAPVFRPAGAAPAPSGIKPFRNVMDLVPGLTAEQRAAARWAIGPVRHPNAVAPGARSRTAPATAPWAAATNSAGGDNRAGPSGSSSRAYAPRRDDALYGSVSAQAEAREKEKEAKEKEEKERKERVREAYEAWEKEAYTLVPNREVDENYDDDSDDYYFDDY